MTFRVTLAVAASPVREQHTFKTFFRRPRQFYFDFLKNGKPGGERLVVCSDDHNHLRAAGQPDHSTTRDSASRRARRNDTGALMTKIATTLVVLGMLLWPSAGMAQGPPATVPLCAGLKIVTAISDQYGDYESIKTVASVTAKAVSMNFSSEIPVRSRSAEPGRMQQIRSTRSIPTRDLASSTRYARMFSDAFPALLPGTTALGTSTAVLTQLKTKGHAELAMPNEGPLAMMERSGRGQLSASDIEFADGTIRRVGTSRVMIPVVVNDARVELPTIHARGEFFGEPAEFFFLDDPDNPIALRYAVSRGEFSDLLGGLLTSLLGGADDADRDTRDILNVVTISHRCAPRSTPAAAPATTAGAALEKALAESGRADLYSIFFSFNSDRIREESDATIDEIAAVLGRHPDWKLSIAGHTDNIGSDSDNLDLSRRRAAAVKEALIKRHRIAADRLVTTGHGESRPRDTNETLQGRARNRRVELVRVSS
jgi:outer membrane protein OmpA-like peptidoglycan-associated protein